MTVHLRTVSAGGTSLGWSQARGLTIDCRPESGTLRVGFDALELLGFSIAASYANTLLDEADRRRLVIHQLAVDVSAAPGAANDFSVAVSIEADADESAVMDLIEMADKKSAISNLLR